MKLSPQTGSRAASFAVDDFDREIERPSGHSVIFTQEPLATGIGTSHRVDNTCGIMIRIVHTLSVRRRSTARTSDGGHRTCGYVI